MSAPAAGYVVLPVPEIEGALRFWRDGIGLTLHETFPGQAWLRHGDFEILLDATGEGKGKTEVGLCLELSDLDVALNRLRELGFAPIRGPGDFGGPLGLEVAVRDPAGHTAVLYTGRDDAKPSP